MIAAESKWPQHIAVICDRLRDCFPVTATAWEIKSDLHHVHMRVESRLLAPKDLTPVFAEMGISRRKILIKNKSTRSVIYRPTISEGQRYAQTNKHDFWFVLSDQNNR